MSSSVSKGQLSSATRMALLLIVLMPMFSLGAYWTGGAKALLVVALVTPLAAGFLLGLGILRGQRKQTHPAGSAWLPTEIFEARVKLLMKEARAHGLASAVLAFEIDDFDELKALYKGPVLDRITKQFGDRLASMLRGDDIVNFSGDRQFVVCVAPQPRFDLEACMALIGRITRSVSDPYTIDGVAVHVTASAGFCQLGRETATKSNSDRDPVSTCARDALAIAKAAAPSAVRSYSGSMSMTKKRLIETDPDAVMALERGEIEAWFQPQLSTDTGRITGFEALARWAHPSRGILSPAEFMPQLEQAGKMVRLSEVMVFHALSAMKAWDEAGLGIQHVGVNFSTAELSDPKLVEKISWELDRFELPANRLAVEILETVVAQGSDDVIALSIKGLRDLGCHIDLDDFGTGHASISALRRFGVARIKIDRSYVARADRDAEQQRMIRAILTMAEKLNIETLAEGVETVGEHSLLAQLGCTHVQGFGIARPMPFDQTVRWVQEHNSKLQDPPFIGQANG